MKEKKISFPRDLQYYKFCAYGFLKNQKFFDPFIILFFREMGITFLAIGSLYSIREIATNIFEVPSGILADTWGRRKAMIASFTAYIASFIIFFYFTHFFAYAVAMVFFAFGEAFRTGTHKAMILEYLKLHGLTEHKVNYYGHTRGWSQFGSAISALIAAALVFYTGSYRIIFAASVLPYFLDLILMISYPKELDGKLTAQNTGGFKAGALLLKSTFIDLLHVLKDRETLKALGNGAVFDAVFKTVKDYLQPILKKYALLLPLLFIPGVEKRSAVLIGVIYFILFMMTSSASRNADGISRRFKNLHTAINRIYLIGILVILAAGIALYYENYILTICALIAFYIIENIKRPMNVGYTTELIADHVMASGLSGESQLKTIAVALLAPMMGFFADTTGIYGGMIALAVVLMAFYPLVLLRGARSG